MIDLFKQLIDSILSIVNKVFDYFNSKKKWKLRIYFLNQFVCTKKIDKFDDISQIFRKPYICKVHKKHIFNTFSTQVILIPDKALFLDEEKRELHINCIVYEGVETSEL